MKGFTRSKIEAPVSSGTTVNSGNPTTGLTGRRVVQ